MNILILGATGFIGSAIATRMLADGHAVTGLGRNPGRGRLQQPGIRWIGADLSRMTSAADWIEIIEDQDVVINCAGALQDGLSDDLAATQTNAMLALYNAARQTSQQRIVQISARTAGAATNLPFLSTKRRADEALAASGLPYVILRPAPRARPQCSWRLGIAASARLLPVLPAADPCRKPCGDRGTRRCGGCRQ